MKKQMNKRVCSKCRKAISDYKELDLHHIIPRGMGGKDEPENLMALCRDCHNKKGLENKGIFERIRELKC